jgi:hypothetical protein
MKSVAHIVLHPSGFLSSRPELRYGGAGQPLLGASGNLWGSQSWLQPPFRRRRSYIDLSVDSPYLKAAALQAATRGGRHAGIHVRTQECLPDGFNFIRGVH